MKALVGAATLLALAAGTAPARPFTNTEGKTIEAQIVRADAETVTLRLQNRRLATIPRSTLSEPDREFVATWLADRVPRLRFTPGLVRSNRDERYGTGYASGKTARQIQGFEMAVEVRNDENTKGLETSVMRFILVGRSLTDSSQFKILSVQSAEFTVPPSGQATVPFTKVINYYYDSKYSRSGFKCIGYVLHAERKRDQREIYAHGSTHQLERALPAIVSLQAGDLTDDTFVKPPAAGEDGKPAEDAIIVR